MIRAVIFDLDGTLVDSNEVIIEVFQELFAEFGFPVPDAEAVRAIESAGRARIVEGLLPGEKRGDGELMARMDTRCSVLAREALVRIRPMGGAREILEFLRGRGMKVALATNRGSTTADLLGILGLAGFFEVVVTARHVANIKPHPEPLLLALERLGVGREEALFVGDNEVDLRAGRAAGIKTVLLTKEEAGDGVERVGSLLELKPLLAERK